MSRAPHGARGLKHFVGAEYSSAQMSRPARGAWIETETEEVKISHAASRPARGAWIETY